MIDYWEFMAIFMTGGIVGMMITLGIQKLSRVGCRRRNCERSDDGYCAKCHADYYG